MGFNVLRRHGANAFRRLAGACLGMAVLAGSAVSAQPGGAEYLGMRVTLSLNKTEILVGEPLFLNVNILNETANFRKGNFGARLFLTEGNDIEITVQPPGELPYRYTAAEDPAVYSSVEVDLDNGEAMDHEVTMLYDRTKANGYVFDKPGVYTVKASVRGAILRDPKPFRSELPPTQIVVRAPQGREAEAFNLVNGTAMARSLQQMLTDNAEVVAKARQVAEQYPETPYAPLCRLMSGLAFSRATPPAYDQAAGEFLKFIELYPEHPRAAEATFTLVVIYTRAGRTDLARDWFYFVKDAYPSYRLLRRENPVAAMYYYGHLEEAQARPWWLYQRPWEASSSSPPAAVPRGQGTPAPAAPAPAVTD